MILAILIAIAISGCGVETASTVVTVATMKKKEIEQGKATMNTAQQKIDQAMEQVQQSASSAADVDK